MMDMDKDFYYILLDIFVNIYLQIKLKLFNKLLFYFILKILDRTVRITNIKQWKF